MTVPPPTPKRPLKIPAVVPMTASLSVGREGSAGSTGAAILDAVSSESETARGVTRSELLEALRAAPGSAAILTDVDGTLAPIVERPEEAQVPQRAGELLQKLGRHFGLVACISGRQALEARRLVGADGVAYAGNHGLELLSPGEAEPHLDPALEDSGLAVQRFAIGLDPGELGRAGLRLEDKGPIQALHWRGAVDEGVAESRAREIAEEAVRACLKPHWGRKVLELRPTAGGGKDAAVSALLGGRELSVAAYAGDDRTDLDAFRRLRELRGEGALAAAFCIGVVSPEAPAELAEQADLQVEGPADWLEILERLGE
jgi:trehalose 6-phosphate phosphatase